MNSFYVLTALFMTATAVHGQQPAILDNLAGLRGRVEITRDREGVPHIRARSEADALFGLGFMHAQDRLWQLEFLRRLGRGRLAEVLGPSALDRDRMFRTLGVAQAASATWAQYKGEHRRLVEAYVAGLNASTARQRETGSLAVTDVRLRDRTRCCYSNE